MAVGMTGSAPPAQASTRTAIGGGATLTRLSVAAAPATATSPATTYIVPPGETLSGIAARFAVHGGWPALYAANRRVIGPDPNAVRSGTVLMVPGLMSPVRYTVGPGDSLSVIAAALAVRGGWPALYAANRRLIGPDPNAVRAGIVITIPRPAAPSRPAPGLAHPRPHPAPHPAPRPSPATGARHHPRPTTRSAPATGMPRWLKVLLLVVGLCILAAFVVEPVAVIRRRRRQAAARAARLRPADADQEPGWPLPGTANGAGNSAENTADSETTGDKARIVLADHDRLVVTRDERDDTTCVLRPPGADPRAILKLARLVMPEGSYEELAEQLGLPANWPME